MSIYIYICICICIFHVPNNNPGTTARILIDIHGRHLPTTTTNTIIMSSILRQPSHHRRALILLTPLRTSPSSSSPTLLSTRPYAQTPSDPSDSSTQTTVVPADEPTASPDSDPRGPPDMSILQRATPTHTPLTTYLDPTGALDVTKVNIPLNIDHKPEPRPDTRAGTYAVRDDHPLYAFFHKDPLTGKYDAMRRYTEDEVNLGQSDPLFAS